MSLKKETRAKKLVTILVISTLVTVLREKGVENAEDGKNLGIIGGTSKDGENLKPNFTRVLCIQYPIVFKKKSVLALFDSSSEVNTIHPTFAKELGLFIKLTDVKAQKIDGTMLDTYRIAVAAFLITNKVN